MTVADPSTSPGLPRVYLAGPEVFLPEPIAAGAAKKALCERYGLVGVYPLDLALQLDGLDKAEASRRIFLACEALMRSCDLLIANLTPFRGASADVGTAYEMGYARALGKPVFAYTNTPLDYRRRAEMVRAAAHLPFDGDFAAMEIEDFGLADNLMLAVAAAESGTHVVQHPAAPGTEMTDLAGFEKCLALARSLVAA